MKFRVELILNKNRDEVWKIFDSTENLYKWQPSLKEFSHISGEEGQPGAKSKLVYLEHKKEMTMTETISIRKEPEKFSGIYEMKGTKNSISNSFIEIDSNQTKWIMDSEFEFNGFYKLMSPFFKGMIVKRTKTDMNRFKYLVEGNLK